MKRLFLFFLFCNLTLTSFSFGIGNLFIYNSHFWRNKISLDFFGKNTFSAGATFNLIDHKDREDKIYAFHLPLMIKFSVLDLLFEPFIYPDISTDAKAYGGSLTLNTLIKSDDIARIYVSGYLKTSLAEQKASITRQGTSQKENFKQLAFESGLNFNLANLYSFNINGNVFSYPDGINDISAFGGIMDQNDMADLGTIDYVLNLPNFSLGGGITWLSPENNTKTFFRYKYINYEHNIIAHSIILQTVIPVSEHLITTFIYNHVFQSHNTNKDLFGVGLNYLF